MLLLFSHIFECQSIRMSVYAWTFSAFVCLLITVYKRTHFLFLFIFFSLSRFFFKFLHKQTVEKKSSFLFSIQLFFLLVYMFVYDMKRNWIFQFISKCICFYIYTIKLTLSFHSISPLLADTFFFLCSSSSCWFFFFHIMSVTKNYFFFFTVEM